MTEPNDGDKTWHQAAAGFWYRVTKDNSGNWIYQYGRQVPGSMGPNIFPTGETRPVDSAGDGGNGGNGGNGGTHIDPSQTYIPTAQKGALRNYADWVKWKRKELENLISRYRVEYPKQIQAFKTSAEGALPEQSKDMWGKMYQNLNQRGLDNSSSFLAGAKQDHEGWLSGEKANIASTAQGMETAAQSSILAALGKPDYNSLYQGWNDYTQKLNNAIWMRGPGSGHTG